MASNAFAGVGATFKRGDGSSPPETFTAVAEVRSITGPGYTREIIDVTSLDSTGGYREFITGFRDGGEVTFTMNFTLDGWDDLLTDFDTDATRSYQIVLNDAGNTTFDFEGLVTALPLNITPDDAVTSDVTVKVTGQLTLTS